MEENKKKVIAVFDFRTNKENFKDYNDLHKFLETKAKKWVFQLEKGEQNNYEHYQGRISLIKKTTKQNALKLTEYKFNYIEPTLTENINGNNMYILKEQTRIQKPETNEDWILKKDIFIPNFIKTNIVFYPYQNSIINSTNDNRTINILYDCVGNIGKSYISNYCEHNNLGFRCPQLNDFKDIMQLLTCYCKDKKLRDLGILFFDLPRAMVKDKIRGILSGIEEIKSSGRLFDTRNHLKLWYINPPIIWVFTNELIDTEYLSKDRWKIWIVNSNKELEIFN